VKARAFRWTGRLAVLSMVAASSFALAPRAGSTPDTITGTTITATAGVQFSGLIATSDLPAGEVSVDWGDTTVSSGTVAPDGSITGTHTYATEGSFAITLTSPGTTGSSTAIVLSPGQAAALGGSDIASVPGGGSGTASVLPGGPGITATLDHPAAAAVLFVAVYDTDPEAVPVQAVGFYDVRVVGTAAGATLQVVFHDDPTRAGVPQLLFFDRTTGTYVPVQSSSLVVDQEAHTITARFDATSTPAVTDLAGTAGVDVASKRAVIVCASWSTTSDELCTGA